jgi:hypothetical protein
MLTAVTTNSRGKGVPDITHDGGTPTPKSDVPKSPLQTFHDSLVITGHHYLRDVVLGADHFDLDKLDQLKAFEAEIEQMGGTIKGLTVCASNGKVYSLVDPQAVAELRQDAADGKIDGIITAPVGSTCSGTATTTTTPAAANNADPAAASGGTPATTAQPGGQAATPATGNTGGTAAADGTEPEKTEAQKKAEAETQAMEKKATDLADSLGPEGLMNLIRAGKLPPDIANSPAAMQIINMRISDYQQMVTMMSNMLKLMHDLQMAIVNNMR